MALPQVVLKPKRARPFFARHPWLYGGSIDRVERDVEPGSEVRVISAEGVFVARGLYNPESSLRVRLYRWSDQPLDEGFWHDRLRRAFSLRQTLGLIGDATACRVVYSEADELCGLTVDRYGRWLVAQVTSRALWLRREMLTSMLRDLSGCEGLLLRFDADFAGLEGVSCADVKEHGSLPGEPLTINDHEVLFEVDLRSGQKTGFYLDQAENRVAAARYARGKHVLDTFCYTGGFGLHALRGGADSVSAVDSSSAALELARRNAARNDLSAVSFDEGDVFGILGRLGREGRRFGMVVCDPPKFARTARDVDDALRGYVRLNRAAVAVLESDGILVTCSCSGHIDRGMFQGVLAHVAELSGRSVQILEMRGQAADHPIAAACPETEYLKCAICRVA